MYFYAVSFHMVINLTEHSTSGKSLCYPFFRCSTTFPHQLLYCGRCLHPSNCFPQIPIGNEYINRELCNPVTWLDKLVFTSSSAMVSTRQHVFLCWRWSWLPENNSGLENDGQELLNNGKSWRKLQKTFCRLGLLCGFNLCTLHFYFRV